MKFGRGGNESEPVPGALSRPDMVRGFMAGSVDGTVVMGEILKEVDPRLSAVAKDALLDNGEPVPNPDGGTYTVDEYLKTAAQHGDATMTLLKFLLLDKNDPNYEPMRRVIGGRIAASAPRAKEILGE